MSDLTPEGERRRDEILADALRAARRRRVRRRGTRALAVVAPLALFAIVFVRAPVKPRAATAPPQLPQARSVASASSIVVTRIADDSSALARHAVVPMKRTRIVVTRINDDDLLRELNAAGRRAGLASIGGRHVLLLDGEPITAAR